MNKEIPKWKIETRGGGQIADTGDYSDPFYVLTNGDIELVTRDELDDFHEPESYIKVIVEALNQLGARWEDWKLSDKKYELSVAQEQIRQWKKIAKDLYNSLTGTVEEGEWTDYTDAVDGYREALKTLP